MLYVIQLQIKGDTIMANKNTKQEAKKETKQTTEKETEETSKEKKHQGRFDEFGNQVEKFAVKTADSIRKVIDRALASRNTVLTIRVNDESNEKLNMLVEAGLFKSRSESAAFLIEEGIKSQNVLFSKITDKLKKLEKIRDELKDIVSKEVGSKSGTEPQKKK
jgi:Arc/MetJ-type ribon-helix-helix transcriptional regulator